MSINWEAEFESYCSYLEYRLSLTSIKEVYLYGIGYYAKKLLDFLETIDVTVLALLDDGYGTKQHEFNVPIQETRKTIKKPKPIVIASREHQDIIHERLFSIGIERTDILKVFIQPDITGIEGVVLPTSQNKELGKKKEKLFFIADNNDTLNFGCQATSTALADILSQTAVISDKMYRKEILGLFAAIPFCEEWTLYASAAKRYNRSVYQRLMSRIKQVDAVVINGEGSFVFQSPPRLDLHVYLIILLACIEASKPFYVLNFMFSSFGQQPMNIELMRNALALLENADGVCVRDLESKSIIESENGKVNVKYFPDALFTWYNLFDEDCNALRSISAYPRFALPFSRNPDQSLDFDFTVPYALFSGNSYSAHYPQQAENAFVKLTTALKKKSHDLGVRFYLIECCVGDGVLVNVSSRTRTAVIPVYVNIYLAGYILSNAQCFVTGRYHPAILASLGGAPCVFMGANSHKTTSLQTVLEIPHDEQQTFSAIPEDDEIPHIVEAFEEKLRLHDRELLKSVCRKNAAMAYSIISQENPL